ncbi:MAG TPA: UDP-glucose 4-epimerase GalE, partial [Methylomirabilota bacterium]|nr:UDP-glucose 4-epimerase GalE [Methylomirabilota bacterium]
KARQELGWRPRLPKIGDIVASAWRWHQKFPNGYPD